MLSAIGGASLSSGVMCKIRFACLMAGLGLILLAMVVVTPLGAGLGAFDREMGFCGELHNSLYHLDQAKSKWERDKNKSDGDVPTMEDLGPYLGTWTNSIKRFVAAGIEYKVSPISEESQSDIATFTRNVSFQRGFCRFYRAGTRFSLRTGWTIPQSNGASSPLVFYHSNRGSIAAALFVSGIGTLLVYTIMKMVTSKRVASITHEHRTA